MCACASPAPRSRAGTCQVQATAASRGGHHDGQHLRQRRDCDPTLVRCRCVPPLLSFPSVSLTNPACTLYCRVTSHQTHALNATTTALDSRPKATLSSDRSSPSIRTRGTATGIIAPHHCAIPATRSPHTHPRPHPRPTYVRSNNHRHSKVCGTDRPRCSRGENQEWHACWKFPHPPEG